MLWRLLFLLLLSCGSLFAQAARFKILDAVSATGASRGIDNRTSVHQGWILAVNITGAPTGCTISIQGSDDDGVADAYADVTASAGTSNPYTCTSSGRVVYFGFSSYVRANLTALSGGTSPTVTAYLIAPTAIQMASTLGVTQGGTGSSTAFTAGSVVFAGTGGTYTQDNANFFWDDSNNRLGLGLTGPLSQLHLANGDGGSSGVRATRTSSPANGFLLDDQSDGNIVLSSISSGVSEAVLTVLETAGAPLIIPNRLLQVATYYRWSGTGTNPTDTTASIYNQAAVGPTVSGFSFSVRTDATTPTEQLRVRSDGDVQVLDALYVGSTFVAPGANNLRVQGDTKSATYSTVTNCADGTASPADCTSAAAGGVIISAAATTVTVNTTAVTANSQIFVQEDSSLGTRLSVTCNTTTGRDYTVTARTAATSFVITSSAAPTTNPACLSYFIVN